MSNPKVLVVGINPWIDNTGINTLINFFECYDKEKLAHLYTREGLPNTKICDTFFRISESKVVKSVLKRKIRTGEVVYNTPTETTHTKDKIYKKKNNSLKNLLREFIWKFGKWKTKALDEFLESFDADVLFFPVYANVFMCRLQNYIAKKTGKPVVLYSSDDNYSYKSISKSPFSVLHRCWLRKQEKKLFKRAEKIMVISPKQKEEYDRLFKKDCVVLTKGVEISDNYKFADVVNDPVKMVYTGKLIIGRGDSLSLIADALEDINREKTKVELDIYTTDVVSESQKLALNKNGCSIKGALTLSEVAQVQSNADVLVFVEGLKRKYKNAARLSFSTKITDYLKSGKCIFAIGDKDIAPMDYFRRYDCAVIAHSKEEVKEKLTHLIQNKNLILEYGKKAYETAKLNHSKEKTNQTLMSVLKELNNR